MALACERTGPPRIVEQLTLWDEEVQRRRLAGVMREGLTLPLRGLLTVSSAGLHEHHDMWEEAAGAGRSTAQAGT